MDLWDDSTPDVHTRQDLINQAFVTLSDSLVRDFDVIDVLNLLTRTCVEVLGVDSAGLLLTDGWGRLKVLASSSEAIDALELFTLQAEDGPCIQTFRTGEPMGTTLLRDARHRWPAYTDAAITAGYVSFQVLPMRLRADNIGALHFLHRGEMTMTEQDLRVAQALADVATIAIVHDAASRRSGIVIDQLQHALDSRVVIEQATGQLAQYGNLDVEQAFEALRTYCRSHRVKMSETAYRIVRKKLAADDILSVVESPVAVLSPQQFGYG